MVALAVVNREKAFLLALHLFIVCLPKTAAFSEFKIFSWNLLAPVYTDPAKFPSTDAKLLDWSYREPLILDEIAKSDASVICLQEVQVDLWHQMSDKLCQLGYQSQLQDVSSGHPVACATLVKKDFGKIEAVESRSRALISVIDVRDAQDPLFLANVHLEAGMGVDSDGVRFCQLRSLMKRINNHVRSHGCEETPRLVMAGDFNMISDNPVYSLLSEGKLPKNKLTCKRQSYTSPLLPVHDVYSQLSPKDGPVRRTFRTGYVLDYIWVSEAVKPVDTWQCHSDAANSKRAFWPSNLHPSDHLPVGATLALD